MVSEVAFSPLEGLFLKHEVVFDGLHLVAASPELALQVVAPKIPVEHVRLQHFQPLEEEVRKSANDRSTRIPRVSIPHRALSSLRFAVDMIFAALSLVARLEITSPCSYYP